MISGLQMWMKSPKNWDLSDAATPHLPHPTPTLLWSWDSLSSNHLPLLKVNKETGLDTDSWGAYERNEFSEPGGLHLPKHRMIIP